MASLAQVVNSSLLCHLFLILFLGNVAFLGMLSNDWIPVWNTWKLFQGYKVNCEVLACESRGWLAVWGLLALGEQCLLFSE